MQIIEENARESKIRVRVETGDDLWELSHIIGENDFVRMQTERKVAIGADKTKQVRKPMTLTIQVIDVAFDNATLRVNGQITEGPEDLISFGDHHAFSIREQDSFELQKNWDSVTRARFDEAVKAKPFNVLLVVFDRESAYLAELTRRGHKIIQHLKGDVSKKAPGGGSENFWKTIAQAVTELDQRNAYQSIVAASPAFWNEYLVDALADEQRKKVKTATCSAVGESAVAEVARRPEVGQVLADHRASQETLLVDEILTAVHTDSACYGVDDCAEQAEVGRVKMLVVTRDAIHAAREQGRYEALDAILEKAKSTQAHVHILQHNTTKIDSLGGIAGVLRW